MGLEKKIWNCRTEATRVGEGCDWNLAAPTELVPKRPFGPFVINVDPFDSREMGNGTFQGESQDINEGVRLNWFQLSGGISLGGEHHKYQSKNAASDYVSNGAA